MKKILIRQKEKQFDKSLGILFQSTVFVRTVIRSEYATVEFISMFLKPLEAHFID